MDTEAKIVARARFNHGGISDQAAREAAVEREISRVRASLAKGARVLECGTSGRWCWLPPEGTPLTDTPWGERIPSWQEADRVQADRALADALPVGGSAEVGYDWHPRHGWKTFTVTRIA